MIAGCYSLELYCENYAINDGIHQYSEFPHSYTDEFGYRCRSDARRDGWKLDIKKGKAICPKCNKVQAGNANTEQLLPRRHHRQKG